MWELAGGADLWEGAADLEEAVGDAVRCRQVRAGEAGSQGSRAVPVATRRPGRGCCCQCTEGRVAVAG